MTYSSRQGHLWFVRAPALATTILCSLSASAETGFLELEITDAKDKPIAGVILATKGPGTQSAPTDAQGRTRLRLAPSTPPNSLVQLRVASPKELEIKWPFGGVVRIPPFGNDSSNFASLVLSDIARPTASTQVGDSISVVRVIDPPGSESSPTRSTIWVRAAGKRSYILDSIDVHHMRGNCTSIGDTKVLPSANYSYYFGYGSKKSHALEPALRLDPAGSEQETSFTLGLAPEGFFPSVCGHVSVRLNYHSDDGSVGSLTFDQGRADAVFLAQVAQASVEFFPDGDSTRGMEASPSGAIRELAAPSRRASAMLFSALDDRFLDGKIPVLSAERRILGDRLFAVGSIPKIADEIRLGRDIAFDLCASMKSPQCERALLSVPTDDQRLFRLALHSLAVRHCIFPSRALSRFILDNREALSLLSHWTLGDVVIALAEKRVGDWADALLVIAAFSAEARRALLRHRLLLSPVQTSALRAIIINAFNDDINKQRLNKDNVELAMRMMLASEDAAHVETALGNLLWQEPARLGTDHIALIFGGLLVTGVLGHAVEVKVGWNESHRLSSAPDHDVKSPLLIQIPPEIDSFFGFDSGYSDWVYATNHPAWLAARDSDGLKRLIEIATSRTYGGAVAIAILAGGDDEMSGAALAKTCADPRKGRAALRALAHRHLHLPSKLLAECSVLYAHRSLPSGEEFAERDNTDLTPLFPLLKYRSGPWDHALVALALLPGWQQHHYFASIRKTLGDFSAPAKVELCKGLSAMWSTIQLNGVSEELVQISVAAGVEQGVMTEALKKVSASQATAHDGGTVGEREKYWRDEAVKRLERARSVLESGKGQDE